MELDFVQIGGAISGVGAAAGLCYSAVRFALRGFELDLMRELRKEFAAKEDVERRLQALESR